MWLAFGGWQRNRNDGEVKILSTSRSSLESSETQPGVACARAVKTCDTAAGAAAGAAVRSSSGSSVSDFINNSSANYWISSDTAHAVIALHVQQLATSFLLLIGPGGQVSTKVDFHVAYNTVRSDPLATPCEL